MNSDHNPSVAPPEEDSSGLFSLPHLKNEVTKMDMILFDYLWCCRAGKSARGQQEEDDMVNWGGRLKRWNSVSEYQIIRFLAAFRTSVWVNLPAFLCYALVRRIL